MLSSFLRHKCLNQLLDKEAAGKYWIDIVRHMYPITIGMDKT
jgi:hypothetical protein